MRPQHSADLSGIDDRSDRHPPDGVALMKKTAKQFMILFIVSLITMTIDCTGECIDLAEIKQRGKLRHLGIVYANFVNQDQKGLDVELMQLFAKEIGVAYELIETSWKSLLTDLTGQVVTPRGDDIEITGTGPIKGDVIATGFTVLAWRKKIVDFSLMTFPTGVWLITRADSTFEPIKPTGNILRDIDSVREKLDGVTVLSLKDSCLDANLYGLKQTGAIIQNYPVERNLDGMIPSVLAHNAETTLMDVPVALIALAQRPGEIKVIGPISPPQKMACAFAKDSPQLRKAFNRFFAKIVVDGTYRSLVQKYYPQVFSYYPDFLSDKFKDQD